MRKINQRLILSLLFLGILSLGLGSVSGAISLRAIPSTVSVLAAGTNYPNCGPPTKTNLASMVAANLTLSGPIGDSATKRSLTPSCSAYYELDRMMITSISTGDCGTDSVNFCDVHLQFDCTYSTGCLFEIDQTWLAAGYTYPTGCSGS